MKAALPAEIPVGGSTGLDHGGSAAVDQAVAWLAVTPRAERGPAVPELKARFGLSAVQACEAIGLANRRPT
jgi:hypothetical protein